MARGDGSDSASNIGGFHSDRELWMRPEIHQLGLPSMIGSAVQQAAHVEAAAIERIPISTALDEAWLNALPSTGWNVLHTHILWRLLRCG